MPQQPTRPNKIIDVVWATLLWVLLIGCFIFLINYLHTGGINVNTILDVFILGGLTLLRVMTLVIIATLIWVPIGVYVGLRPKLVALVQPIAQFLAAFPANILFPFVVIAIVHYQLNPNICAFTSHYLGNPMVYIF